MKNHNVSHIAGVISLSCTLRGFNVDPLYGRPKLCLTGLGPHNDSLICKLIQVCNWPSIETTGALNSKTLFFYDYCSAECHACHRDLSAVWGKAEGEGTAAGKKKERRKDGRKEGKTKNERKKERRKARKDKRKKKRK